MFEPAGVVHEECGQLAAAADAFERANEKDPSNVQYLISMARVYGLLDRKSAAAEAWRLVRVFALFFCSFFWQWY